MGRYVSGDFEYKFWFACQPSSDILEYGEEEERSSMKNIYIKKENLKTIKAKVNNYKKEFKNKFKTTYKAFMNKMEKKGYLSASDDEETQTEKWGLMSREASRINLGEVIISNLIKQKSSLCVEAEF
jgi:hypothetical protein